MSSDGILQDTQVIQRIRGFPTKHTIGWILPSFVDRGPLDLQMSFVRHIRDQFQTLESNDIAHILIIGMQHGPDAEEEATRRLNALLPELSTSNSTVFGVRLNATRKVHTLNSAIAVLSASHASAIGWVDDDVELSKTCLQMMAAQHHKQSFRGAIGATKIARRRPSVSGRTIYRLKRITNPATNYPHGCCILVQTSVVQSGIPIRYNSDDGFVCLSLLRPRKSDPLELLRIAEDCKCFFFVGSSTFRGNAKRIARILINHHVLLADFPREVSRFYLRSILFAGLWPIGRRVKSDSVLKACGRWFFKFVYFLLFICVGGALIARGLSGYPLRSMPWGGEPEDPSRSS